MPSHYVAVRREALENFLKSKGFKRTVQSTEIVYVFPHLKNPSVVVKVYTSIRDGSHTVRGCGEDAIRVATVFENGPISYGVGRFPKVLRTGSEQSVLDRTYSRIQEAYLRGSDFIRTHSRRR
jgi:hypothetical protein